MSDARLAFCRRFKKPDKYSAGSERLLTEVSQVSLIPASAIYYLRVTAPNCGVAPKWTLFLVWDLGQKVLAYSRSRLHICGYF